MALKLKKFVSVMLIVAVILNMVLFGLGRVSAKDFWIVIAVAAVLAYAILPRIKN